MLSVDVAIIGGGIVGLATAWQLQNRHPRLSVAVLEKERQVAAHQSGHNSGVLHSGIYYRPGSLRATNCRAGKLAMQRFCEQESIPHEICGKVIVAVDEQELPRLDAIAERGVANGVRCERIGPERLRELEPHVTGLAALHVPEAGIVDYPAVCERLAARIIERGGQVLLNGASSASTGASTNWSCKAGRGDIRCRYLVTCGGLQADRVTRLCGIEPEAKIVPFRGEYFELSAQSQHLCRNLIYPVPDPGFPFLGVHFTRMIGGGVECGPNAVLAFSREGYSKLAINLGDLAESLSYGGFRKLAANYWRTGAGEMWRSLCKRAFVRALQRLVPDIQSRDLTAAPSGVRAQAVGRDGKLLDDFLIQSSPRVINVCNAPSPAATASLNIGSLIVDRLAEQFG
ncbi:MAG: L-2-hydroxyglutarate oxidase [Planctomycetaceae bacterium]